MIGCSGHCLISVRADSGWMTLSWLFAVLAHSVQCLQHCQVQKALAETTEKTFAHRPVSFFQPHLICCVLITLETAECIFWDGISSVCGIVLQVCMQKRVCLQI